MSYLGVNPRKNIYPFIIKKPESSYPQSVKKEIHLISFNKNGLATPFGSYTYRVQKYPGDIDLLETYFDCCDIADVVNKFENSLKKIVKEINKLRTHYFSEFKAGTDERYNIDIGEIGNGLYIPNKDLLTISEDLFLKKLLNQEEFNIIKKILSKRNSLSGNDYDIINFIFRERKILRWSADEILKGIKKLSGNKKIYLKKALSMKSPVKIDIISVINGRLIEITNFIMLAYMDEGNLVPINLDFNLENKDELFEMAKVQLPEEIQKLYYSDMYYSPFKMVKRMYALARQILDKNMLYKILPFISSNTSLLYQIKSEIDTIILIYERVKNPPIKTIQKQLDEMKGRIATVIELSDEEQEIVDALIDMMNETNKKQDKIDLLKQLKKYITLFINFNTISYLNSVGLNPPPRNYLPPKMKYASIIRQPNDNPENPYKNILSQINGSGCEECGLEEIIIEV